MEGGQPKLNKPCILLIVIAGMERFAFKGVAANLVTYLTEVMKMKNSSAAKMVNNWCGFTSMLPLVVASLADSYWDKYTTILVSSFLYLLGLVALTSTAMEWPWIPTSKTGAASCLSWSLYMISLGQGGYNPSLQAFAADQLDHHDQLPSDNNKILNNNNENKKKSLFFHWWYFGICTGCLLGISFLAYIQDNIGWGLGFAIPTAAMLLSIAFFTSGSRFYTYNKQTETAKFTKSLEYMVAAFRSTAAKLIRLQNKDALVGTHEIELEEKKSLCLEGDIEGLGEIPDMNPIDILKAAWRLFPIWVLLLTFAVIFQQPLTFFTKQGMTMKRNIMGGFKVPPAALQSAITISIIILMPLYDAVFVPFMRRMTRNEKGITVMQRMGVGMFLSVVAMAIAAVVEEKRLRTARKSEMSIFWLLPQYIILGISDIFTVVGMQEFFYGEVPARMKTMGIALCTSVFGVGNFMSAFLITAVEKFTGGGGEKENWFSDNMDEARLDKYYWLLAMASAFTFLLFIIFCKFYTTRT
ncbi:protein NRT1/ PTR FAMILY 5.8-like [Impatiens glandulifera]|uniref:protein NRT1/ PTR FAMILY 5.8-like n=1 Tax=Impatiens glandulifera TaxID=253017 RepID=UPI001FB0705E|nr:protein NRT1/ PTR FAMILY 5.8-like [Impatiens glandulifera]